MSISIKPGATLEWLCVHGALDLTGYTIEAALGKGDFYQALTVTPVDLSTGQFKLSATPAQTEDFPVGPLLGDIKLTSGDVSYTDTFRINVLKKVTK